MWNGFFNCTFVRLNKKYEEILNTTYNFNITASDGLNTSSRAFAVVVNSVITLNYLVVAGGGGGGRGNSGGGGAGGLRGGSTNLVLSS